MDGRVIFFDDDPDSRFDCEGNRVRVYYEGDWHWFSDVKSCDNRIKVSLNVDIVRPELLRMVMYGDLQTPRYLQQRFT